MLYCWRLLVAASGSGLRGYWFNHVLGAVTMSRHPLALGRDIRFGAYSLSLWVRHCWQNAVAVSPAARAASADVNSTLHRHSVQTLGMHQAGIRNFLVVAQVGGALNTLIVGSLFSCEVCNMCSASISDLIRETC